MNRRAFTRRGWGAVLLAVLAVLTVVAIGVVSSLGLVMAGTRAEWRRESGRRLFRLAESGLQRGMFAVSRGQTEAAHLGAAEFADLLEAGLNLQVVIEPLGDTLFDLTSTASDAATGLSRTLHARVRRDGPALAQVSAPAMPLIADPTAAGLSPGPLGLAGPRRLAPPAAAPAGVAPEATPDRAGGDPLPGALPTVFDCALFLDNHLAAWERELRIFGDLRANGDVTLSDTVEIEGRVFAHGAIRAVPGHPHLEGTEDRWHPGVDRLRMPNLFARPGSWEAIAEARGGTVRQGETTLIRGVRRGSIHLHGTEENPIRVDGPVAVTGDVILRGQITGRGTLSAGRNLYIAGDLTYARRPPVDAEGRLRPRGAAPGLPPTLAQRLAWVRASLACDLVVLAARENIFFGDVTHPLWRDAVWPALAQAGDESALGPDGLAGTADDGTAFEHDWDGDGALERDAWFDADGDTVLDRAKTWDEGVALDLSNPHEWSGYPLRADGTPEPYGAFADDAIERLDGVFCAGHAFAGRTHATSLHIGGAVAARDAVIVAAGPVQISHDERLLSAHRLAPDGLTAPLALERFLPGVVFTESGPLRRTEIVSWSVGGDP